MQFGKCAVIGAGTMGPGMAFMMATTGSRVDLMDVQPEALEKAKTMAEAAASALEQAGELSADAAKATLGRINFTSSLPEAVKDSGLVLEAVPEKLELKQKVYTELEEAAGESVILASNTSGIPVGKLQEGRRHPSRVVGMHWSNPPHVIPMIEVIRGAETSDGVVQAVRSFVKEMKYVPVTVKRDIAGFVENRILYAIMREALHLVDEDVASIEDIDTDVRWGIGMKLAVIGPLALLDVAGLDVYHSVAGYLNGELSSSSDVSNRISERVERGDLGVKTGHGLFRHDPADALTSMQARNALLLRIRKQLMTGNES